MIQNGKGGLNYLAVKKVSSLLREVTLKYEGGALV